MEVNRPINSITVLQLTANVEESTSNPSDYMTMFIFNHLYETAGSKVEK